MHEHIYPTEGRKPVEVLHNLLVEARVREDRYDVTLGSPPFARDGGNRIVGIRLRFTPRQRAELAGVTTSRDFDPA